LRPGFYGISAIAKDWQNSDKNVMLAMAGSIASAVLCVLANKYLFQFHGFKYATFLTFFHMASNSLFVKLTEWGGWFEPKIADWTKVFPLACSFVASVVSLNLSLQYNSVGFFQVMKILIIPCLVIMQFSFWNVKFSTMTIVTLIPIMIGVAIATVTELNFSMIGAFYASVGCVTTALHQIWGGTKQKDLQLNALQVLSYQAPLSAVILIPLVFILDDVWSPRGLYNYEWSLPALFFLIFSAVAAYGVNITSYIIVGKASPVTYQVLGHFKTILVLSFGMLYYDSNVTYQNLGGILIAFVGTIWYGHVQLSAIPAKPSPPAVSKV